MSEWTKIADLQEIPPLGSRVVQSARGDIAVFRTSDDKVYALHDRCPHKGGPLSQGIVHGDKVTCPLHGWNITLTDGHAVAPDEGQTPCVEVRLEGTTIYLKLRA